MSTPPVPSAPAPAPAPAAPGAAARGAPGWLLALYLGGLAFVYLGERVLSGLPRGAEVATVLGVVAAAAATGIRFAPRFRSGGERKSIESLLAVFSLVGLCGLLVYFVSGPGAERLGIDSLASETRDRVSELARVVWVSLIVLSALPMVFAEFALRPMRRAERPESRRVRAAITTGLALALSAIYGCLLVYAASGVDLRVDYSYFKTSRPSDSTKKLVSGIVKPIEIVAFFPDVNEVRSEVEAYLREVAAESKQIQLRVEDRLLLPKLAKELAVNQDGAIVLRQGDAKQSLTVGTAIEQARPKLKTLDRDFQEQLVKLVQSRKTAYVTVGHGELSDAPRGRESEGARSGKIVRTLLQRQNYTVKDLGMAQGLGQEVPTDADIVLVLGPTEPLTRQELDALSRYYRRGGRLILALDPDAFSTRAPLGGALVPGGAEGLAAPAASSAAAAPSAAPAASGPKVVALGPDGAIRAGPPPERTFNDDLAEIVGVKFASDVLANEKQHVRLRYNDSDRARLVTNSFSSHAAVSTLSRNAPRAAAVFFGSGSLEKKPGDESKVDFAVRSLTGTFRDKNRNYTQDKTTETLGLFNLAAAVSRPLGPGAPSKPISEPSEPSAVDADSDVTPVPALSGKPTTAKDAKAKDEKKAEKKDEPPEMRAFVVADADAFSDFVMGEVVGNQILLVDAVRWLVGESSVQGLPNTEEDVRIEHTKQADLGWFYATIFGIPGLVLGSGLWFSRRTRGRARS